jgi:hypothetical protein|eukprot:Transcript_22618.p2 GENE.Transcript_22618~~Transcript_22618.p2  ORF type:complete len:287 (-),score=132.68 Transcript_22618:45-905(-)
MSGSGSGSALRIGGSLAALIGCASLFYHLRGGEKAQPLYVFQPHHIVWLFGASNTAFLSSTLLLLWRVLNDPKRGALGISLHAQRLNLAAVLLRCLWVVQGHFSTSWLTYIEATLSIFATVALAVVIDPQLAPYAIGWLPPERRPLCATPEAFPSVPLFAGCLLFALCLAPLHAESAQWGFAAAAIYVEAGGVLPQRALLLKTKALPALTSHAFFLLAIAGALRLAMWVVLMLEGELHVLLMLGDFLHTAFLADFVVIYFRSLAASGLEGLLGGSDVQLGSLEASV